MTQLSAVPTPKSRPFPGLNILLEGPSGTGKTYSLHTLVDWAAQHSMNVCVLFTESGLETLIGYYAERKLTVPPNLFWHLIDSTPLQMASLIDAADKVGRLSYEAVTKLTDPARGQNNTYAEILRACDNFTDQRTGKNLGSVSKWGSDTVFVIDGLTELSVAAMKMVIGNKPTAAPPDYGIAQNNLMNFLRLLTNGCTCHFVLLAHVGREKDEISGGVKLMTKTVGAAISGDIPPLFSDVIFTVREADKWYWDTANMMADVKTRNLPIASKIDPDFGQIFAKWLGRKQAIEVNQA
ncbi:hypothetical protein FJY94_06595 [Candidatus Kaiserbacteria bacterium]|nr:hypothetical protein [Candidatus Kaiserbacteria bacterium]